MMFDSMSWIAVPSWILLLQHLKHMLVHLVTIQQYDDFDHTTNIIQVGRVTAFPTGFFSVCIEYQLHQLFQYKTIIIELVHIYFFRC